MGQDIQKQKIFTSVPAVLRELDKLEKEVWDAPTFDGLIDIQDRAAGLQRRYRPVKAVRDRAGEVWISTEARLGEELNNIGPGYRAGPGRGKAGTNAAQPLNPTLKELGVAKKTAARAKKIVEIPIETRVRVIDDLKEKDKPVNPATLLAALRAEAKKDKIHLVSAAEFSEEGPFGTVVIDPPWKMEKIDREVRLDQDSFDYPTMGTDELLALWNNELAFRLEEDCHLFMWTTQKYLPETIELIRLIDFRYVVTMVWHKAGGFQPVGLPQFNCEFVVYARRGTPVFIDTKDFPCCFEGQRREHSRKPDEFYDTIRRVTGGSRIDVFSREPRGGFAQYGNEIHKWVRTETTEFMPTSTSINSDPSLPP